MATFNYNKVNLAAAQIPSAITASQTSITVDASESALFPTVPFFATIMPAGGVPNTLNSEIVQVTAINTTSGVLTITRAQRGTTAKAQDEGAVIMNGVYIEDLAQAQAVSKSFFSAKLSSSVYYIQDARLTTTPENGDSIRVVFGLNWKSGTPKLSLNSGTPYNIYAGNNLTASHGTTNTPAMVKSGIIYELTYYNGAWYILNLTANSSITSDNVDWATFKKFVPDYSNKTTLSLNSSGGATLSNTGWVSYYYYGYSAGREHEIWIKVNGVKVFDQLQEAPAPNSARAIQGNVMFPVSAGDVITQSGASAGKSAQFIPGKWV